MAPTRACSPIPITPHSLREVSKSRFCLTENGDQESGAFSKVMIWCKEGNHLKALRVIGSDH